MLGTTIADPDGVEGAPGEVPGLALLDVRTDFVPEKTLALPSGSALGARASGYEIHHGRVTRGGGEEFLGGARSGAVFGTMWHGALEGDALRSAFLAEALGGTVAGRAPSSVSFHAAREARIDRLGDLVEEHLDVAALLALARSGAPAGLPFLPPGGAVCES
jgi:adenosylcobyric acid synthase